jgi:hypothetical protein
LTETEYEETLDKFIGNWQRSTRRLRIAQDFATIEKRNRFERRIVDLS